MRSTLIQTGLIDVNAGFVHQIELKVAWSRADKRSWW